MRNGRLLLQELAETTFGVPWVGLSAVVGAALVVGPLVALRRGARASFVEEALLRRYGTWGTARIGGDEAIRARIEAAGSASSQSVFELLAELSSEIERSG